MHDKYMLEAIKEAKKGLMKEEVPVGCIIVNNGKIIARAYNKRETKQNALLHAEIIAINKACKKMNSWRLDDCDIYVTLEPCPMCAGAIIQSRIKNLYYGANDTKSGAAGGVINLFDFKFNHIVSVQSGILESECSDILKDFFKQLRTKNKKNGIEKE